METEKLKNAHVEQQQKNSEQPKVYQCDELREFKSAPGGPWYESFLLRKGEAS